MKFLFLLLIGWTVGKDAPPATHLLSPATLMATKQKLQQGDPTAKQALAQLLKDADGALKNGPYSVTFKSKTPPSGSKHDYMSVGPYWWPDSSKPGGIPYIRKDGQVNPERFTIKDADYYTTMNREVLTLGLAYYFTKEEKYAAHAAKLVRTWFLDTATRMNPNLNYGQAIPGKTDGRGIGLIDTRNCHKLFDGLLLIKDSKALKPAEYAGIQAWYKEFLHWMMTSPIGLDEQDEFNNHGTWYDVQAIGIALFTGEKDLAKKIIEEQTKKRIDSQLETDGRQPHELARTLSWNYSGMNLKGFFEIAMMAENVGIDLWNYQTPNGKSLKKAYTWMLPFAEGRKPWEHKQIKDIHFEEYVEMTAIAAKKFPSLNLQPLRDHFKDLNNDMVILTDWTY